jgi:hypothetical protein
MTNQNRQTTPEEILVFSNLSSSETTPTMRLVRNILRRSDFFERLCDIAIALGENTLLYSPSAPFKIFAFDDNHLLKTSLFSLVLRPAGGWYYDVMDMIECGDATFFDLRLSSFCIRDFPYFRNDPYTHVITVEYRGSGMLPIFLRSQDFARMKKYFSNGARYFSFFAPILLDKLYSSVSRENNGIY